MNDQNRIKLAEAMRLLPVEFNNWDEYRQAVEDHDGEVLRILLALIPDPFTDANDCEALIAWLTLQGWYVEINFQSYPDADGREDAWSFGVFIHIWHIDTEQHERTDCDQSSWKQGLCRLAACALQRQGSDSG